jgi:hypothetical protein
MTPAAATRRQGNIVVEVQLELRCAPMQPWIIRGEPIMMNVNLLRPGCHCVQAAPIDVKEAEKHHPHAGRARATSAGVTFGQCCWVTFGRSVSTITTASLFLEVVGPIAPGAKEPLDWSRPQAPRRQIVAEVTSAQARSWSITMDRDTKATLQRENVQTESDKMTTNGRI